MVPNSPETLYAHFAIQKIGAYTVPVNTELKGEHLAYILDHSDARILIIHHSLLPVYERAGTIPGGSPVLFTGEHKKMKELLGDFKKVLSSLEESQGGLKRGVLWLLDRQATFKNLMKYALDQAWYIPRPLPYQYCVWWPWLKNYDGEITIGYDDMSFMWYLWIFGDNIEEAMGHVRYTAFYLICGLFASLSHALSNPDSTLPSIGASGAISGVLLYTAICRLPIVAV
jgi:hypothetical protein